MGAGESVVRNVDKRTSRREHKDHFVNAISLFRDKYGGKNVFGNIEIDEDGDYDNNNNNNNNNNYNNNNNNNNNNQYWAIKVFVRKRPIFQHEITQGEFDCITGNTKAAIVHDARMHPNMRTLLMNHHEFHFDSVFNESDDNEKVYKGSAQRLVKLASMGGTGTIMMYGQTGSGKTYTMEAIYRQAANDLFHLLKGNKKAKITVSFVELAGEFCSDMLNVGKRANLMTANNGDVYPFPVVEVECHSPEDLINYITHACGLRQTQATGVHDASSRSHAICRIFIQLDEGNVEGKLTLVDLAGSEFKLDSSEHSKERRKEGAQINSSLMNLKECVRELARKARTVNNPSSFVSFRKSKLTHMLRSCFDSTASMAIIATISPSSKDTEHSLNTLRHACIMDGQGEDEEAKWMTGGKVMKETIGEINVTQLARERRAQNEKMKNDSEGLSMSMGTPPAKELNEFDEKKRKKLAEKQQVKQRLRAEKMGLKNMTPEQVEALKISRDTLYSGNHKQRMRMTQHAPEPLESPQLKYREQQVKQYKQQLRQEGEGEGETPEVIRSSNALPQINLNKNNNKNNHMNNSNVEVERPHNVEGYIKSDRYTGRIEKEEDNAVPKKRTPIAKEVIKKCRKYAALIMNDETIGDDMKKRQIHSMLQRNGMNDTNSRNRFIKNVWTPAGEETSSSNEPPPRVQQKMPNSFKNKNVVNSKKQAFNPVEDLHAERKQEIAKLESMLSVPGQSNQALHGLKRRLATQKSLLIKEQRKILEEGRPRFDDGSGIPSGNFKAETQPHNFSVSGQQYR